jgi:hypothetical protein
MLGPEREMIGLLVKGASTPLENIQVSFFLVAWSTLMLVVLRMVRNGNETKGFIRAGSLQELAQDFAEKNEASSQTETRLIRRGLKRK